MSAPIATPDPMRLHPPASLRLLATRVAALTVGLAALGPPLRAQAPAGACRPARTALVLGGGGGKGFAHVGLFRALDSAGVRPDLIVGTSIGAITGALYASGYTARQIDSLTRALPLDGIVHGYEPRLPGVLGDAPAVAVFERRNGRLRLQTGAVQESEINALMSAMLLRGNLTARGDFDRLPIPFRAVATDMASGAPVVLGGGDLARAVRASFAIPVVFQPVVIDGKVLNDGGMASNVPIAVARALGAERVIVSTLPSEAIAATELDSPFGVAAKLVDALVRNEMLPLGVEDVLVKHRTEGFDLLDFGPVQSRELIRRGYADAQAGLARAACLQPLRREAPAAPPSAITVARVADIDTLLPNGRAITRVLGLTPGARLSVDTLRERLLALGETGRYRALWLYPSAGRDGGTALDLVPLPAPRLSFGVGAAFDGDNGARGWVAAALPSFSHGHLDLAGEARAGRYQQEGRLVVRTVPGALTRGRVLTAELRGAHEDVRRFIPRGELPAVGTEELAAFAGIVGGRGPFRWSAGPSVVAWHSDTASGWRQTAGGRARLATSLRSPTRLEVVGEWTGRFRSVSLDAQAAWQRRWFTARPYVRAGVGADVPMQRAFLFGGFGGFPGLRIGDGRADRMGVLGVMAQWRLLGPLAAEAELAAGAMADRRDVPATREGRRSTPTETLTGARVGVRIDTPAGAIRIAEGFNSRGQHVLYLRLGRWY